MSTDNNEISPHDTTFSVWLKQELNRLGWSQREFKHRANIGNPSTVSMWLSGKKIKKPALYHCVNVAKALNRPWQLVVAKAYPELIPPDPDQEARDEIIHLWSQLSQEDQIRAKKILQALAEP